MEPLPSEVSSPLQPLQALGVAVSASLACAEEMVPQRMLRRTLQAETGADAQKGPEHRADMKFLIKKATASPSQKNTVFFARFFSPK